jgi:hypothetical protein
MKNIQLYEKFCISENERLFLTRHNLPATYDKRVRSYGLSDNPTILQRTENFFERMEDRLNKMARIGSSLMQQKRADRGPGGEGPNTGVEVLFGLPSVVPSVLKRIFGPTKFERIPKKDEQVDVEFIRHTNEDFVKNELPSIKTEKQLEDNVDDLYKRGGVKVGEVPALDDIAKNRANIYYAKQINPNQPVLEPNN